MNIGRTIYTVSLLSQEVKRLLEASYASIQVEGEITGLSRPASGHQYFSIKDENSQLKCVFFKHSARLCPVDLSNGKQVILSAKISLYEQRGDFQLIVQSVVESGEGLLRKRFEQLKSQLSNEGLFAIQTKSSLPALPDKVGIITSTTGAAVHDIISVFKRRYPAIKLLIYPALVQGELAAESIVSAIDLAVRRNEVDVLIVGRGGGSLEDLWPFNEEIVARAIFRCSIPLVSAVGHESDISISDLVADVRAATPTAAAELLSPDKNELIKSLSSLQIRLENAVKRKYESASQQLDRTHSSLAIFSRKVEQQGYRYRITEEKFLRCTKTAIKERAFQFSSLAARINTPDNILKQHLQHSINVQNRMNISIRNRLHLHRSSYTLLHRSLLHNQTGNRLKSDSAYFNNTKQRLLTKIPGLLQNKRALLENQVYALQALSPLQTLSRGFATLQQLDGNSGDTNRQRTIVSSVEQVQTGDVIQANLKDGQLLCEITQINREKHD